MLKTYSDAAAPNFVNKEFFMFAYFDNSLPRHMRFVRVSGDDGIFYDLVDRANVKAHIAALSGDGYDCAMVSRAIVPPCRFRRFDPDGISYHDASWCSGVNFYFAPDVVSEFERIHQRRKQNN